jgi:hypothetical protein
MQALNHASVYDNNGLTTTDSPAILQRLHPPPSSPSSHPTHPSMKHAQQSSHESCLVPRRARAPLNCAAVFTILLLAAPLVFSAPTVQNLIDQAAPSGSVSLPAQTFSGVSNCNSQVNASHTASGTVTITGSASTTIDCSGTGLTCLSVSGVSVVIQNVKFIGNRALFPQPSIPVVPTAQDHNVHASSAADAPPEPHQHTQGFSSRADRARDEPHAPPDILSSRFSQLSSLFPLHPILQQQLPTPASTKQSFSSQTYSAGAAPSVPLSGGCLHIFNSTVVTIQSNSFSNCASAAFGGSVAIFNVITVRIIACSFTDSLVNVVNVSQLDDPSFQAKRLSSVFDSTGGGVGYGGAVFVAPKFSSGVSLSVSGCVFLRCQVVATSNNYDFSDFINKSQGVFLQGGAFAAFLPIVNKSRTDDPGYLLSITSSSFSQCLVLFSSNRLSQVGYDIACGGAISVFDDHPRGGVPNGFLLPPSRVVLQDLTFSGAPKCMHLGLRFGVARAVL